MNAELKPGENFKVYFSMQNISLEALEDLRAVIKTSGYWAASVTLLCVRLAPAETKKFDVEVRVANVKNIAKLPPSLEIQFESKGRNIGSQSVALPIEFFLGAMRKYKPPGAKQKVNILIFGQAGSGKTTLIKTYFSMIKGRIVRGGGGPVGGGLDHASVTYRELKLTPTISIFDPWGATANNYGGHELELMLSGALPPGWEMEINVNVNDPQIVQRLKLKDNPNRIDAVFFTLSPQLVQDVEYLKKLKHWASEVAKYDPDMTPFLLLTKIDEINADLRNVPDLQDDLLQEKLGFISAETGIPETNIFSTLGYISERENNFLVDKLSHVTICEALNACNDRYDLMMK